MQQYARRRAARRHPRLAAAGAERGVFRLHGALSAAGPSPVVRCVCVGRARRAAALGARRRKVRGSARACVGRLPAPRRLRAAPAAAASSARAAAGGGARPPPRGAAALHQRACPRRPGVFCCGNPARGRFACAGAVSCCASKPGPWGRPVQCVQAKGRVRGEVRGALLCHCHQRETHAGRGGGRPAGRGAWGPGHAGGPGGGGRRCFRGLQVTSLATASTGALAAPAAPAGGARARGPGFTLRTQRVGAEGRRRQPAPWAGGEPHGPSSSILCNSKLLVRP